MDITGSTREIWTVGSIIKTVTEYLGKKKCETPRLDAEVLLSHVLKVNRVGLYTGHDTPLLPEKLELYRELVKRRAAGEPAAYLVGHKEFYSLDFKVGPGVLVPRPETEFLAISAIEEAKARPGARIADIGTGSGCLAVTIAAYVAGCEVIAVDISDAAVRKARENAIAHDVHDRITVVQGNLFEPLEKMGLAGKLDIVLSNPPYVSESEFEELPASIRDFEPREALVAGSEGTEFFGRIMDEAPRFLAGGGLLAMELGAGQFGEVAKALERSGSYGSPWALKDYGGTKRVVMARRA